MKKSLIVFSLMALLLVVVGCSKTTFTVTFNSNGGSAVNKIENIENNAKIAKPTDPTKTGYVFSGWYKESALENPWNFETDTVKANITLYAKWAEVNNDAAVVDSVHNWLNLGNLTDLTNSSPRIIMPITKDGVTISWAIDKTDYIKTNGMINQPTSEVGTQTVTLTATLTKGTVTKTKTFTATVKALPGAGDMPPLLFETFKSYTDGNIVGQQGMWGPVSGKSGNSQFTVVSSISGTTIPLESKALKIEALSELQIEAPLSHNYDVVVIEVDVFRNESGSSINIQSSASSPVIGFGLTGSGIFYRVDNGTQVSVDMSMNRWYKLRLEANLTEKTIELFYYEDNQLIPVTQGKVTYTGNTNLSSLIIRSGSSTTTELLKPAYLTNLNVNRIESLPRPTETVKLGEITGIEETKTIEVGTPFTPDTPVVKNYFGSKRVLIKDVDYKVEVSQIDVNTPNVYTVTYTITSLSDATDVKTFTQTVTVYTTETPSEIIDVDSTIVGYFNQLSTVTINFVRAEGTLFYLMSNNETETAEAIKAGNSVTLTGAQMTLTNLDVTGAYIHLLVVSNDDSEIVSHAFTQEEVVEITTKEAFYTMATVETTLTYVLMNDLDFTGFTWNGTHDSFKGKLYGNGYTISNLTVITGSGAYGGIFSRVNGAHIENLVLDNIKVDTTARAGALIGRVENVQTTIKDIVLMNSSVKGADSNGVGGLIGLISKDTVLSNISVTNTTVIANGQKNVGGLVGRVDNATLTAHDIYMSGVTVRSTVSSGTDIGAGALVGYVRDSSTSIVNANRVVIVDTKVDGLIGGGLIGYLRNPGSATVENAYVIVEFINTDRSGIVGRINAEADGINHATVFGKLTNVMPHSSAQPLTNDLTGVTVDSAWWSANLNVFTTSTLWTIQQDGTIVLNITK